jgi:hypothetical protein
MQSNIIISFRLDQFHQARERGLCLHHLKSSLVGPPIEE